MKNLCIKAVIMVSLLIFAMGPVAFSADVSTVTIEVCHGGFTPLDHANGMVFTVKVISGTPLVIENLTIDTQWWDSTNTLHYPYVDNKAMVTDEIGCQDTPDVIFITGAEGTINGIRYDLLENVRVVSPDRMGINPIDYTVKPLIVSTE